MKAFLNFDKQPRKKGVKTDVWDVWTEGKPHDDRGPEYVNELGTISWWSHWRRYVFSPKCDVLFDAGCLREIAAFCEQQMRKRDALRRG